MAKNTFAFIGILAVLLMSLGMVSAAVDFYPDPLSATVNHNSQIDITFKIYNQETTDLTDVTITTIPDLTSGLNTISSGNLSLVGLSAIIPATSNSSLITLTTNIPNYQTPGTYIGVLTISGKLTAGMLYYDVDVEITVNSTPSLSVTKIDDLTKTTNGTIKVTNNGNVDLTDVKLELVSGSDDFSVNLGDIISSLAPGSFEEIEISSPDAKDLDFRDDNSISIKATSTEANSSTILLEVTNSFYDGDNDGKLKVSIDRINVAKGFGDDEKYWYPLDEIELKIEVENNGNWDVGDIELKICLLDEFRGNCVFDEDDMDIEEGEFDLDSGDNKNILVTFNVDPNDLREGNTEYTLYISAVGKIDDHGSPYDNNETGYSTFSPINIRTDEEFVILDEIILSDLSNFLNEGETSCSNEVRMTAKVWNVGDKDLDNDEVFVQIYNKELGINKVIPFNNGIDSMDWEFLETTITIPSDVQEKTYSIKFTVYDNENLADKDIYDNKEDDEAKFYQFLKVINCKSSISEPTISASLDSEAKIGEELIITATITNNGEDNSFVISATGFEEWAELVSVEPQTLSIDEDDTEKVLIKLIPTKKGLQTFKINVIVDGETYDQSVSVNIAEKEEEQEEGFFTKVRNNTMLYGISVGIVAVLILIFLTFIVKISRKSRKVEPF